MLNFSVSQLTLFLCIFSRDRTYLALWMSECFCWSDQTSNMEQIHSFVSTEYRCTDCTISCWFHLLHEQCSSLPVRDSELFQEQKHVFMIFGDIYLFVEFVHTFSKIHRCNNMYIKLCTTYSIYLCICRLSAKCLVISSITRLISLTRKLFWVMTKSANSWATIERVKETFRFFEKTTDIKRHFPKQQEAEHCRILEMRPEQNSTHDFLLNIVDSRHRPMLKIEPFRRFIAKNHTPETILIQSNSIFQHGP